MTSTRTRLALGRSLSNRVLCGALSFALVVTLTPFVPGTFAYAEEAVSFPAQPATAADAVPNELIVTYVDEAVPIDEPVGAARSAQGVDTLEDLGVTGQEEVIPGESNGEAGTVTVVQIADDADAEVVLQQIEALSNVASVQPNYSYSLMDTVVSDPYFASGEDKAGAASQYYLSASRFSSAWEHVKTEGAVTVAVVDSGCNLAHEDLQGVLDAVNAYDATTGRPLSESGVANNGDAIGHGTMVAGVVGAQANNGIGIAGASYNAKVLPIKVFDEEGRCTTADLIAAYDYLAGLIAAGSASNLKVVNLSLGYYADALDEADSALQKAIASLRDDYGVLTVCAAGNGLDSATGTDKLCLPSDFEECLSVTALNESGAEAAFSNYNDAKDLSAYGESILSTDKAGTYSEATGTSMAAPQVAAAAALLWAADASLGVADVFSTLQSTATPIEGKKSGSAGALDAAAAVAATLGIEDTDAGTEEGSQPDDDAAEQPQPGEAGGPQGRLRENSWRYEDGERLIGKTDEGSEDGAITLFAGEQCVWTKRGNTWYSSEGGKSMYVDNAYAFGIDVSYHNGRIDWAAAKRGGVDFAIIRCGWGDNYSSQDDAQFINNVRGCIDNGIPFGIYLYSYAVRTYGAESASSEADHVLRCLSEAGLSPASLTYPVYYDMEDRCMPTGNKSLLADMAQVFCNKIAAAGYTPGVYANLNWFNNYLTDSRFNNWSRWIAQYAAANNGRFETSYKGKYDIWQCMSNGKVSGIGGNVDINFDYKGFDRTVRDSKGLRLLNLDGTYAKNTWYTNGKGQTFYFGADTYALKWGNVIDSDYYYFNGDGSMHKGWLTWSGTNGRRSYFGADGKALKGWQTIGGTRYYFEDSGSCKTLQWGNTVGSDYYYFNGDGSMHTGWLTWGGSGSRSYFGSDGKMYFGTRMVDGVWYDFGTTGRV